MVGYRIWLCCQGFNMKNDSLEDWILGIDLGTNSLGWAVIGTKEGVPERLIRAGARVFESAMEGNSEAGKEESRNRARREARLARRQHWRRARRLHKTFNLLQRFGLLATGASETPQDRQDSINRLDRSILTSEWFSIVKDSAAYPEPMQVLPYILRARSLDERLEPHAFGRALYHLAQRRGFLSNRKQERAAKKEDEGPVKKSIGELEGEIEKTGARTLGEFFGRLSPTEKRIRTRYTARKMYKDEFNKMWEAQAAHHPTLLTPERKKLLFQTVFHQRPLKFDPDVIGRCELERDERRAPAYLLVSQRFRLLDRANNLEVIPPGETSRPLTVADRAKLIQELELKGDLSFKKIRELLGLPKNYHFNLEEGGEEKLPGNRTAAQFYGALCQRWLDMPPDERDRMVEYVHGFEKPEKLEEAARKKWGLDGASAEKFADVSLEPDYLNLSRRAIEKVLPLLEEGVRFATARKQVYPRSFEVLKAVDFLPPVMDSLDIRNPGVMRSLTELRKVANAIIREYGKPAEIRIELARELKKPKKVREATFKKNRENQKSRIAAAKRVEKEVGLSNPSRDDIRKVQLAEECGWLCPYTGQPISMRTLLSEPQFDIEHIIPFSRSLDDSFVNVTLCAIEENRNRKGNKTPYETYRGEPARYEEILERVTRFSGKGGAATEKLRRFKMTPDEVEARLTDFTARQLGDTAYASRLAAQYLGLLYGGTVDAKGTRRVQATSGQVTAFLRNEWKLNGILQDGPTSKGGSRVKSRDDHRHHAVDAVAIGLTSAGTIKMLSDAAQRAHQERRRRFGSVQSPWVNFVDTVREEVESIVVSHRVSRRVSGPFHKETNYALCDLNALRNSKEARLPRTRKLLKAMNAAEVERIADESVKRLVIEKLKSLGVNDPEQAFSNALNLPHVPNRNGPPVPIKKVRVKDQVKTVVLGEGRARRFVRPESNHHLEIYAEVGPKSEEKKWGGEVVTMHEAYQRLRQSMPIIQRNYGPLAVFKFSIASGETLECDDGPGKRSLFIVRSISKEGKTESIKVEMIRINDARLKAEVKKAGRWTTKSPNMLFQMKALKKVVSPVGGVSEARD